MCRNCHALKRDFGHALYERDLQIANFRPGDVLKHDEADGAVCVVTEDTICNDHSRQQNDPSDCGSNTDRSTPSTNGYIHHINLRENCRYENSERKKDDDELDKDKNHEYYHRGKAANGNGTYASASCSFVKGNRNGDDDVYDDNEGEKEDGNCVPNCNNQKDAECYTGGANELGGRHGDFDVNRNGDEDDDEDDEDDHDGADDQKDGDTFENAGDRNEEGENGCNNPHHPHYHYALDNPHSGSGGGGGKIDSRDERAGDKGDGTRGKLIRNNNFGYKKENDGADDDSYIVTKSSSLPVDSIVPGKSIKDTKLATKETTLSLPVNTGLDEQFKSQKIVITGGDNNGNKKPPGARVKTLLTGNEYTAKVPTMSYSQSLAPKTSSPGLPRVNRAELNYLYNSRIPSPDDTGINQNFLARHTTDQSLQHASQTGDFNLSKKSTPHSEWPMWSLPPPDASETERRWRLSSGLHPSVVGSQIGGQSNWQFWNQPSREINSSNVNSQERKSFKHFDPWFAGGAEAFTGLRISDGLPATNDTISGSLFNTYAAMASAYEPESRYSANNSYGSHVNSPTCGGLPVRDGSPGTRLPTVKFHAPVVCPSVTTTVTELQPIASVTSQSVSSSVLPENLQERFMEPPTPNSFTKNRETVRPIISSASRIEEQRAGTEASSLEFPDDPSLAALERKVAEACAVVERVMREREERTKAQREAARKKREMREQREREAREMKEREEREMREREEKEREERKTRERQEREIRKREERDRGEEIENEDRDTRWFGGERAPVQESPRWQCEHYQRRCLVKFPCCGIFYPCHRCHNTSGECDTDDRKANNATHVKCGVCGHEEEINEGSQYCSGCGEQMSAYFCFICKHFTGVEKNPFHCDKCGICRIHKGKSFHCDVCNVCLDKRLEGKHKCRPDSGHDECCICLEDAFSGCQILPCSHKVHKECAIAMIQNGVRNCPICRHPLFSQDS